MLKQEQESFLNINKQRALPKAKVGILIHESIPKPFIIDTAPVQVKQKFDWNKLNNIAVKVEKIELEKIFDVFQKKKNQNNEKTDEETEFEDNTINSVEKFDI